MASDASASALALRELQDMLRNLSIEEFASVVREMLIPSEKIADLERPQVARDDGLRAALRSSYLERNFKGTPTYIRAMKELTKPALGVGEAHERLMKRGEILDLFDLGAKWPALSKWQKRGTSTERIHRRKNVLRSVAAAQPEGSTKNVWKNIEDVLEAYGCAIHGMSEFNLCCEELGMYEFYSQEFVAALAEYICIRSKGNADTVVLEVGAGNGRLAFLLNRALKSLQGSSAPRVVATDPILEAAPGQQAALSHHNVEAIDYKSAMQKYKPDIVLCAWMPMDQDWTLDFRAESSLKEYILVGETDVGNCGHNYFTWGNPAFRNHPLQAPDGSSVPPSDLVKRKGIADAAATFERVDLDSISKFQLQRYDAPHACGNSSTASFRRISSKTEAVPASTHKAAPPAPARSAAWDVFDSDSDDDDEAEEEASAEKTARAGSPASPRAHERFPVAIWKDFPPDHQGPAQFDTVDKNSSAESEAYIGGRRQFVAPHDIEPGTLLLSELPFIRIPEQSDGMKAAVPFEVYACEVMLSAVSSNGRKTAEALDLLHPVKLADLHDQSAVETARKDLKGHLKRLSDSFKASTESILRLIFVVRCNAFASGIYLHQSIFNHSCKPNCVKFLPPSEGGCSEVWATRRIRKGEPLTISYLVPAEQSYDHRRNQLLKQFLFECKCARCLLGSRHDRTGDESSAEDRLQSLEESFAQARGEVAILGDFGILKMKRVAEDLSDVIASARKAHENAQASGGDESLILARALRLAVDIDGELLGDIGDSCTAKDLQKVATRFLRSALDLQQLQLRFDYLGADHPQTGRTHNDIALALDSLMRSAPKTLYAQFENYGAGNFHDAKDMRAASAAQFARIKELFKRY